MIYAYIITFEYTLGISKNWNILFIRIRKWNTSYVTADIVHSLVLTPWLWGGVRVAISSNLRQELFSVGLADRLMLWHMRLFGKRQILPEFTTQNFAAANITQSMKK